jgi:hypothetical protein
MLNSRWSTLLTFEFFNTPRWIQLERVHASTLKDVNCEKKSIGEDVQNDEQCGVPVSHSI